MWTYLTIEGNDVVNYFWWDWDCHFDADRSRNVRLVILCYMAELLGAMN